MYPEEGFLGHLVSFIFNFLRNFRTVCLNDCTNLYSINSVPGFPFLHILTLTFYLLKIATRTKFAVALICIALMISDVEQAFMVAICRSLGKLSIKFLHGQTTQQGCSLALCAFPAWPGPASPTLYLHKHACPLPPASDCSNPQARMAAPASLLKGNI